MILLARIFAPFKVAVRVLASMMRVSHAVALIANLAYSPVEILVMLSGQVISLITPISHLIGDACEPLIESSRIFEYEIIENSILMGKATPPKTPSVPMISNSSADL